MSDRDLFAFDFDGVICDSATETALSAWRACRSLWPRRFRRPPSPEALARFRRCRPVVEVGAQSVLLYLLLEEGVPERDLLARPALLFGAAMRRHALDSAALQARFAAARDAWIARDPEGWFGAQDCFPGVVDAINRMGAERCLLTTKQRRFTLPLVARIGLEVGPEQVFALESFGGGGKRAVLQRLLRRHPGRLHFVEDRLKTLEALGDLPRLRRYLVTWGYCTAAEREAARRHRGIGLLDPARFSALIGPPYNRPPSGPARPGAIP